MAYYNVVNRQNRLSSLFGDMTRWDMSVVACSWQRPQSQEEFDRLCKAEGLDPDLPAFVHEIPSMNVYDRLFNPAVIIKSGDMRQASIKTTQIVYTHIGCVPYDKAKDELVQEKLEEEAKDIVRHHRQTIERAQMDMHFTDDIHAMGASSELAFKFLVHKFDPQLCHPSEDRVIKPLTIMSDTIIKPMKSAYNSTI